MQKYTHLFAFSIPNKSFSTTDCFRHINVPRFDLYTNANWMRKQWLKIKLPYLCATAAAHFVLYCWCKQTNKQTNKYNQHADHDVPLLLRRWWDIQNFMLLPFTYDLKTLTHTTKVLELLQQERYGIIIKRIREWISNFVLFIQIFHTLGIGIHIHTNTKLLSNIKISYR